MLGSRIPRTDTLIRNLNIGDAELCPLVYLSCVNVHFFDDRIDHYLRCENLEQDFMTLSETLGLGLTSKFLIRYKDYEDRVKDFHFSKYHTKATKKIIEDYFSNTNTKLGYSI